MTDVLNPVEAEQAIRQHADNIARGVPVVSNAHAAFVNADRVYDLAYARAYMAHEGPAHEKRYAADVETAAEREARDIADIAYQHARRTAKSLEGQLMAAQSISKSVRSMYGAAGVGE
jgi:hypothetical protein